VVRQDRSLGFAPRLAAAVFVTVLVASALPGGASPGAVPLSRLAATAAPSEASSPTPSARTTAPHPPGLGFGSASPRGLVRPAQDGDLYYTQEGMTIGDINNSAATGVARLSEYVKLVTSPYSTGYELNGLSSSGDWWQIVVADNWPGCNTGFQEVTEVWNDADGSGPVNCDSNLTFSAGDMVEFTLSFASGGDGCLGVRDITAKTSELDCAAQPDTGGNAWEFLGGTSNTNGYYTGPMTETINESTPGCPDYKGMPRLDYTYANGTYITSYTPWSDEFDLSTGGSCYVSSDGGQSVGPADPQSFYVNTAAGTTYGPHWEDGQNYSLIDPLDGFRFETDPKPMTAITLNETPANPRPGMLVNFSVTVTGGVAPYRVLWALDGVLQGFTTLNWTWTAGLAGTYHVVAYAVDQQSDAFGPSPTATVLVPGPLYVSPVNATPPSGDDVGRPVTFAVTVSGGYGFWSIVWSGLPTGCTPVNASSVTCSPTEPGSTNVSVTARDANDSVVHSGPFPYHVFPGLAAEVAPNASTIDVGQSVAFIANVSGGTGGYVYAWSVPGVCSGRGASVACTPLAAGDLFAFLTVTDGGGSSVSPPGAFVVVNPTLQASMGDVGLLADAGTPFHVNATVTGGTAPFSYTWTGLPTGCNSTGPVANCSVSAVGDLAVSVVVRDSVGETSGSNALAVTVARAPSVAVALASPNVTFGNAATFTATTVGGTGLYFYIWSGLPAGCGTTNAATITCTPTEVGNFTVTVAATDQIGTTVHGSATLAVATGPPAARGASGLPFELIALGVAAAVVVAIAVGALWARRRR
jgi:hypothetical protein